ncbi:ROK family transcriptional regulator [Cognatishimia activa]|uniref:ROK family transcriptional regulator n=1 Tax=Cognatishimia activa TaxID=1715691 RepID=A0A975ESG0_9RHOB|nr:ROK family transcriptional regulator [Cognatishimia activa]
MERATTNGDQRDHGRLSVLDSIRSAGEIARIDIADATGFSPATVTAITSELLNAGLIEEIIPENKQSQSRRGRPRVAIKLAGRSHLIAGVKLGHKVISVLVLDFEGQDVVSQEFPIANPRMDPDEFVEVMLEAVSKTCESGGFTINDLSGIGLSMAGLIHATDGFVHWSSSLTERNVDMGALMEKASPCPVFIDNDANLVAKAEHLFGVARNLENFIVITIEHGVGMGIIIDGKIYRGIRGCGAELGHTKVQLEGALCQCGQRGCLEAYVGDYAILREAHSVLGEEIHEDVGSLYDAANNGDQLAVSVLDRAARMLALGLANVVNIFDPELIILAGAQMSYRHLYEDKIIDAAKQQVVQIDAEMPPIRVHAWGDLMWAKGAAAYAIDQVSALKVRELSRNAD